MKSYLGYVILFLLSLFLLVKVYGMFDFLNDTQVIVIALTIVISSFVTGFALEKLDDYLIPDDDL